MRLTSLIAILFALLCLAGCSASIPSESVELSSLVGEMIISAKVSHVELVNRHFDNLRSQVDRFAMHEYKDKFMGNIRKLSKEKDPAFEELTFSQYERAMMRVMDRRSEWLESVENNRREVLQALEEHYTVLLAGNAEVTSLLRSAVKINETRDALLNRLGSKIGISGSKIKEVEDKMNDGVKTINTIMEEGLKLIGE